MVVEVIDDDEDEATETLAVFLGNPSEARLDDSVGIGSIRDNDIAFAVVIGQPAREREWVEDEDMYIRLSRYLPGGSDSLAVEDYGPLTVNLDVVAVGDFMAGDLPTTYTFPAGVAVYDMPLPLDDDDVFEADGLVVVRVLQGAGYTPPYLPGLDGYQGTNQVTVMPIYDNDLAVTVADAQGSESVNGADGSIDFTVSLNAPAPSAVTVDVTTADGDATAGAGLGQDYAANSEQLAFAAGEQEKTFTVNLVDDAVDEDDETFTVLLSNARLAPREIEISYEEYGYPVIHIKSNSPPYAQLHDPTATGAILDDDATMTASLRRAHTTVEEDHSGAVQFEVELSHPTTTGTDRGAVLARAVDTTVSLTIEAGTATAGTDYDSSIAVVVIGAGERSATASLTITPVNDQLVEPDETVQVVGSALNLTITGVEITLEDDDEPSTGIGLAVTGPALVEGNGAAVLTVTATLTGGGTRTEATTATLSIAGLTATAADYSAVWSDPVVTIPAGQRSAVAIVTVTPVDDDVHEGPEEFAISGVNDSPGLAVDTVRLFIADNDAEPRVVTLSFDRNVIEEDSAVTFLTVTAALDGTSVRSTDTPATTTLSDETSRDVGKVSGPRVVISAGETSGTTTFFLNRPNDHIDNDDVILSLEGTTPDPRLTVNPASLTITDDDTAGVTVSESVLEIIEGDSGSYTVVLHTQPTGDVTVTVGGIAGSDLTVDKSVLTFTTGNWDTAQTVTLTAGEDDDEADEGDATITHSVSGADYGSVTAADVTVKVTDDDVPVVTVSFEQSAYSVAEGAAVVVKVLLSADPERTVTVPLNAANRHGASGADYSGVPAGVVFASGETEQTFSFAATDDSMDDDGESVLLSFGSLPERVTAASPSTSTVSIIDDDVPVVTVSFEQSAYSVAEGAAVTVKVLLSADPERTVTVPLTSANRHGASGADYSGVPAGVVFAIGETEQTFSFAATDDSMDDDGESVLLSFGSSLPERVTAASPSTSTVSIIDDDVPVVRVSFEQGSYSVAEGAAVTVKVLLSADPERTVTVPLTSVNRHEASGADYSGVPAGVVFVRGETEKSFTFTAVEDEVDDDGESVLLSFGTLPERVTAGSPPTSTVSIIDDDVPVVTVSFEQSAYSVAEGAAVTVKVLLSADPERTVTVPLTSVNRHGASGADYSGVPAGVVFVRGETEKSFTFTAVEDEVDDDGESVLLSFGTLPERVTAGSPPTSTVSIIDDDVPVVTVSFEQSAYSVAEGAAVTVKVLLSADPERTVTVPLTSANRHGASGADYSGVPANAVFAIGETEQTFSFAATDDSMDDDGESVLLSFGTLPERVTAGSPPTSTVSIIDDDVPVVTVSFEQSAYSVAEGAAVTVKVLLSADPERTVTVPLTSANRHGASGADYSGVPANAVFAIGETEQTFSFAATDDSMDDDGESVLLSFGTLPERVTAASPSTSTPYVEVIGAAVVIGDTDTVLVSDGSSMTASSVGDPTSADAHEVSTKTAVNAVVAERTTTPKGLASAMIYLSLVTARRQSLRRRTNAAPPSTTAARPAANGIVTPRPLVPSVPPKPVSGAPNGAGPLSVSGSSVSGSSVSGSSVSGSSMSGSSMSGSSMSGSSMSGSSMSGGGGLSALRELERSRGRGYPRLNVRDPPESVLSKTTEDRRIPVEYDPRRMCELIVGLGDVEVLGVVDEQGAPLRIHVRCRAPRPPCSGCGGSLWSNGERRVVLVDLPALGRPAVLVWHKRRWRCGKVSCEAGYVALLVEVGSGLGVRVRVRVQGSRHRWSCSTTSTVRRSLRWWTVVALLRRCSDLMVCAWPMCPRGTVR